MSNLIDKAAVVAEIEKKRDAALTRQRNLEAIGQVTVLNETLARELNRIISFINTLEVKEVDLEEEITNYFKGWGNNEIHCFAMMQDGTSVGIDECIDIAKHFFELGIQQSKKDNDNEEKK